MYVNLKLWPINMNVAVTVLYLFRSLKLQIILPSTCLRILKFLQQMNLGMTFIVPNFRERFKDLCSGGTTLCFSLHQTNKGMECFLRFLQVDWTVYYKTFWVHLNRIWKLKYKILEREVLLGRRAKYQILLAKKALHLCDIHLPNCHHLSAKVIVT